MIVNALTYLDFPPFFIYYDNSSEKLRKLYMFSQCGVFVI